CSENPGLSGRYHAGLWSGKRWSCCRLSTRSAEGCDTCSSWSSKPLNATNSSSTSTSSFTSAAGSTVATTAAITDRPQTTNSEANNNPIVHSQARSTIDNWVAAKAEGTEKFKGQAVYVLLTSYSSVPRLPTSAFQRETLISDVFGSLMFLLKFPKIWMRNKFYKIIIVSNHLQ
ncbi:unnamed protein product, partial [Heterotrigona itama]